MFLVLNLLAGAQALLSGQRPSATPVPPARLNGQVVRAQAEAGERLSVSLWDGVGHGVDVRDWI